MNNSTNKHPKGNQLSYVLLFVLFFASLGFTVSKAIMTNFGAGETIYLVINPRLSEESLKAIANRLKDKHIDVTYHTMNFNADQLNSIDVTIDIAVPGKAKTSYTLREKGNSDTFQPLIFYYESDGERVGFVKETPIELSAKGKQIVKENLTGLFIQHKGSREVIGSWQSN